MTDRDQRIAAYDNYAAHAMSALIVSSGGKYKTDVADEAVLYAQLMMLRRDRQIRNDYKEHPPIKLGPR